MMRVTRAPMMARVDRVMLCYLALLCFLKGGCTALDFISADQTIRDGDTIVSAGESFEMGFFSPGNSTTRRYFGIWYKKISTGTVVWVANRETPATNTSNLLLALNPQGILEIQNASNSVIWSSNSTRSVRNPIAQLLDTGNLVIRDQNDSNPDNFIWQSFDFPVANFLPGMKFGEDLVTGRVRYFRSWKSVDDPSPSNFSARIDTNGYPQLVAMEGSEITFRAGPWNGLRFSGEPNLQPNLIYTFGFVLNQKEIYYHYELINSSVITRIVLNPSGELQRLLWIERTQDWTVYLTPSTDSCDRYKLCGAYGSCDINKSPPCGCLEGFEPSVPEQWEVADWSQGCRRKTALDCRSGEGFLKYTGVKLPDTQNSWFNQSMSLEECERVCKNNCSCTAYTNSDIRGGGSGCLIWFNELIDTRDLSSNGQDIYIRMAESELKTIATKGKDSKVVKQVKIIIPVLSILLILLGSYLFYKLKRRTMKEEVGILEQVSRQHYTEDETQKNDLELPLFGLSTLLKATNYFSLNNKLGEGGFGPVYKGVLEEGQQIAVKRLSKTSSQGLEEFKNEVLCISKLQHRNLVKILGCCIEGDEKTLVYEYMPNKGLDSFIFDKTQSKLLDWPQRWHVINGIARGLLYLHQDSRLRIIHRDLKASNILLDSDMNPKISDFGMARSFGGNETQANTNRVVGTYGYMSPEYAGDGIFSVKSDVFSFGVLVLEILSGRRNRGFSHQDHSQNLLGHVWRLHREGRSMELLDESIRDSINVSEALRSIQVGLLCVQHDPRDRPTISSVVLMLGSGGALCPPKHPGFFTEKKTSDYGYDSSMDTKRTVNELTVTILTAR